jgi:hypothetical protein
MPRQSPVENEERKNEMTTLPNENLWAETARELGNAAETFKQLARRARDERATALGGYALLAENELRDLERVVRVYCGTGAAPAGIGKPKASEEPTAGAKPKGRPGRKPKAQQSLIEQEAPKRAGVVHDTEPPPAAAKAEAKPNGPAVSP